jgi:hypothetical protein
VSNVDIMLPQLPSEPLEPGEERVMGGRRGQLIECTLGFHHLRGLSADERDTSARRAGLTFQKWEG